MDSARVRLEEALLAFQSFSMKGESVECLEDYADLLKLRGQLDDAVRVYAAAATLRDSLRLSRSSHSEATWKARIKALRGLLAPAEYEASWAAGRTATLDGTVESALAFAVASAAMA
jgi:hypothetical protein